MKRQFLALKRQIQAQCKVVLVLALIMSVLPAQAGSLFSFRLPAIKKTDIAKVGVAAVAVYWLWCYFKEDAELDARHAQQAREREKKFVAYWQQQRAAEFKEISDSLARQGAGQPQEPTLEELEDARYGLGVGLEDESASHLSSLSASSSE